MLLEPQSLRALTWGEPTYLWLLALPGALLLLLLWQVAARRRHLRRYRAAAHSHVEHHYRAAGELVFWVGVLTAAALGIMALARPQIPRQTFAKTGVDIILLQDASASMHVADVSPNRWQRSQKFVRQFAETLGWRGDRVALALFAHRAAPQLRLTKDPNALFFFLEYLQARPPFRLEDDTTWNTNIAEGLYWGLRLIDTDESLFGRNPNVKAFVVISDGQAWTGDVQAVLETARARNLAVHVIGVGTTRGGWIPEPSGEDGTSRPSTVYSVLDRESLRDIARAGRGEYFELDHGSDRDIAVDVISAIRRRAAAVTTEATYQDIYWFLLCGAGIVLCCAAFLVTQRTEIWWQIAAAAAAILLLATAHVP